MEATIVSKRDDFHREESTSSKMRRLSKITKDKYDDDAGLIDRSIN